MYSVQKPGAIHVRPAERHERVLGGEAPVSSRRGTAVRGGRGGRPSSSRPPCRISSNSRPAASTGARAASVLLLCPKRHDRDRPGAARCCIHPRRRPESGRAFRRRRTRARDRRSPECDDSGAPAEAADASVTRRRRVSRALECYGDLVAAGELRTAVAPALAPLRGSPMTSTCWKPSRSK